MNLKQLTCASMILAAVAGCGQKEEQSTASAVQSPAVKAENIKAHLEFLADDTLKGRDTGSNGYQIAANYVKSNFKQLGLTPMGENEGFEQQVTFRKTYLEAGSAALSITNTNGTTELTPIDQFLTSGSPTETSSVVEAETVFAGYGVIAADFGYDDYKDLDIEGKVVVVLTGRPDDLPSEEGAHLGSSKEKLRHAAERGAVGFITIHTPKREKVRTFEKSAKYANSPRFTWLDNNGKPYGHFPSIKGAAYVNSEHANALFVGAERNLSDIFADDIDKKSIKGFALNSTVKLATKSRHEQITSPNVVAMIEGSDEKLKNEYVVFSGHLDHIGVDEHGEEEISHTLPLFLFTAQDVTLHGFEAQAVWQINNEFSWKVQGDIIRARVNSGGSLPRTPPARLTTEFNYQGNNISADLFVSRYFEQTHTAALENSTDSYVMVDANVNYHFSIGQHDLSVYLKGTNLTDEYAQVHTSFLKELTPLAGRSIAVGIRGSF